MHRVYRSVFTRSSLILALGVSVNVGCDQDSTSDHDVVEAPAVSDTMQVHPTNWIIKFRDAQSLQSALDKAAAAEGLEKRALNRADMNEVEVELRASIEQSQLDKARNRVSDLADRHAFSMNHVRVMGTGADLVDLGPNAAALVDVLRADPAIEYVEPDRMMRRTMVANDTYYTDAIMWHYKNASPAGINVEPAWDRTDGSGTTVAVLDTGWTQHEDLPTPVAQYDFISTSSVGNDGNGRDGSALDPGDWVSTNQCGYPHPAQDSSWHGTHVSGTVAALTNNSQGTAGVAYGANLVQGRVLGTCGGYTSDIADGIIWASGGAVNGVPNNSHPADAINLSLGGGGSCDNTSQNAINTARNNGSVVVVAAGNENQNVSNSSPANCNGVIAVASLGEGGGRASYSNYGNGITLSAPGGDMAVSTGIASLLNNGTTSPTTDTYVYYQGTSMAAPHVAAVAALVRSVDSSLSPDAVQTILEDTSRPIPGSCSGGCGVGTIDAAAAVAAADGGGTGPVCGDGICEPSEEGNCAADCGSTGPVCGDGVCEAGENCDQDCAPACFPIGDSCTSNSDCCSNRCRGRNGRKTCK